MPIEVWIEKILHPSEPLREWPVDGTVGYEFLNDVTFLLENHVMQAEAATSPLRQLYFIVQTMAIDPSNLAISTEIFEKSHRLLFAAFSNPEIIDGLSAVADLVADARYYEALKTLRGLFGVEDMILGRQQGRYTDNTNNKREVA